MTLTALLSALRRYWPYVVIAGLLVALLLTRATLAGQKLKTAQTQAAFDQTVAGYRAAALEREKSDLINVTRVKDESDAISQQTVGSYEQRIAALRADFERRVRDQAESHSGGTASSALSSIPPTTEPASGAASASQLSAQDALDCSVTAERLIALQEWTRKTAAIDTNGN